MAPFFFYFGPEKHVLYTRLLYKWYVFVYAMWFGYLNHLSYVLPCWRLPENVYTCLMKYWTKWLWLAMLSADWTVLCVWRTKMLPLCSYCHYEILMVVLSDLVPDCLGSGPHPILDGKSCARHIGNMVSDMWSRLSCYNVVGYVILAVLSK
jgi:hypothetical protein